MLWSEYSYQVVTLFKIVAQFYPNNESRVTFSSLPQKKYVDTGELDSYPIEWHHPTDSVALETLKKSDPPLSLGLNSKTERRTTGYGLLPKKPTAFGSNARRKIMRAGGALEQSISDPSECLFLTATLPGSTEQAFRAIAEWSGYVVNSLKAWISNHVAAKLDFYVWEYQRRGALHLHYCVHVQDENARTHIQNGFKNWWIGILHRVGEKSLTDLFRKNDKFTHLSDPSQVRAVAEVCRKSPARYLAKYLSKSATKIKGRARFFTPSRFWGTSRPLKTLLENLTKTVEIVQGSYHSCIKKMQGLKTAFESCDGRYHSFNHKYGLGETLLLYPANPFDYTNLLDEVSAMTTIARLQNELDKFKPSEMLKPHKIRLIKWSEHWINELPYKESGMKQSLEVFNEFLHTVFPGQSDDPLMLIYEWTNRLYNLNDCIGYSACGWNREDRMMIDRVLSDLEISIDYICTNGWQ